MSYTLVGTKKIAELEPLITAFDSNSGFTVERRWRGTKAECEKKLAELVVLGGPLRTNMAEEQVPFYLLTATYQWILRPGESIPPSGDPAKQILTIWELAGNMIEKDFWGHPRLTAVFEAVIPGGTLFIELRARFKKHVEDFFSTGKAASPSGVELFSIDEILEDVFSPGKLSTAQRNTVLEWLSDFSLGEEAYTEPGYVLRRTQIAPSEAQFKASKKHVGRWFTTRELLAQEQVPAEIQWLDLPEGEWLKQSPTVSQQPDGRFQVVQEWWFAYRWARFAYKKWNAK